MPVTCSGQCAILSEHIKLNLVAVCKGISLESEAVISLFVVTFLIEFIHEFRKQREQIYVPVLRFGYPCKVVDPAGIGIDVLTLHVYAFYFFKHAGKEFLRMEHFMAATEGFDRGKNIVQHLGAYAHGICEVDNPCIGADFFYFASEPFIDRNCTHCTQHSAGAYGVTD